MSQADQDKRMDYIEFGSTDLDRVKAFYGGVFGWEFKDYGDEYTSFKDGRLAGGFRAASEAPPRGGSLIVLYAMDLEAVQAFSSKTRVAMPVTALTTEIHRLFVAAGKGGDDNAALMKLFNGPIDEA